MINEVDQLASDLIALVRKRAGKFLDENEDAKSFLAERAKRLAEIMVDLVQEKDEAKRIELEKRAELVRDTIENQLTAFSVNASAASRETFGAIMATVFDTAVRLLPTIIAAI